MFQTALFKTHTIIEYDAKGSHHQVVILENKHDGNVVAINKDEDTVIAKVNNISLISSSKPTCIEAYSFWHRASDLLTESSKTNYERTTGQLTI